ncbi:MAG: YebC/PmpR family DNA-binding transcriptional regulator [Clostridia bacterium]|nr:YebC/PmpR family DNA-binding transcriptional regulator [Clostridia bacterium]
MAGHSKWHNRMHRKSRQDAKKGALYSKMAKEIMAAARAGGPEPQANPRLRMAIERAREAGVPNENIERAIRRGAGLEEGVSYEEVWYEGYGPGGVALLVQALTDNRNRTAGEIRHLFGRHGGNLGESGCVSWMFQRKGLLTIDGAKTPVDLDELLLAAAEAGAEDVRDDEELVRVITAFEDLNEVRAALESRGYRFADVDIAMLPQTEVELTGQKARQALALVEALEDHDDVQNVYTNLAISDEELARIEA